VGAFQLHPLRRGRHGTIVVVCECCILVVVVIVVVAVAVAVALVVVAAVVWVLVWVVVAVGENGGDGATTRSGSLQGNPCCDARVGHAIRMRGTVVAVAAVVLVATFWRGGMLVATFRDAPTVLLNVREVGEVAFLGRGVR